MGSLTATEDKQREARPDLGRIDQLSVVILRDWLAVDPARDRGAGEYYLNRLSRGSLLVANEIAIAEYFQRRFDTSRAYAVEMGTGYGELSLLLALGGFRATAFESDVARHAGACALLAGLAQEGVDIDLVSLKLGTFPPALDLALFDREGTAIFVSTNVTSSYVVEHIDSIHRALRLFDHLVVDLARFGEVRDEDSARALADEFERNGFVEVARIYSASGSDVRHFARPAGPGPAVPSATVSRGPLDDVENLVSQTPDFPTELQWVDALDRLLVPVLGHQIERRGRTTTGAYDFYGTRLAKGGLLQGYEIAVARALLERRSGITHVDEIGSGFGELVFLLGWNGFRTRGFEADVPRAQMARRLHGVLKIADPDLTSKIELVEENFPSPTVAPPRARSLVLTTNLVTTRTPEQQAEILQAMRQYTFALVDVQRLFEKREDERAEAEALALFRDAGFSQPELFIDLGNDGRYFLFCNTTDERSSI